MSQRDLTLDARGLPLHALERNPDGRHRLLFLHGWLDHCHSFDWVMDALPPDFRMVALDLRGHGLSAHLPAGAHYGYDQYLADVLTAIAELELAPVHLVGHSLGGGLSLAAAAAAPDLVASATSIESLGPGGGGADAALERLRQFADGALKVPRARIHPTLEAAVQRLRENNSGLTEAGALHLVRHGVDEVEGGVRFRFDPAHRKIFGLSWDEEQVLAVFGGVRCPVQILHGTHGFSFDDAQMQARLARLRARPPRPFPGHHHVHLEAPGPVAAAIEAFVREVEASR